MLFADTDSTLNISIAAGVLQVDALMNNQLSISPMIIQLPSALETVHITTITLRWLGAPHPAGSVAYEATHLPAAAITVNNGWYGTDASISKVYAAASVKISPEHVVIHTNSRRPVARVQVCATSLQAQLKMPLLNKFSTMRSHLLSRCWAQNQ
jgi:hypothetical protein